MTLSDIEKIALFDKLLFINDASKTCSLHRWENSWANTGGKFYLSIQLVDDLGTKIEFDTERSNDLGAVIEEAHARVTALLARVPQFNNTRTIEHQPAALDDEIPY